MKFDTVIIGGGLSGLVAGIRLQQEGQRCIIISSGQSALHFSSGSFDLLNALPDGSAVKNPIEAVSELIKSEPSHPYAKMGEDVFKQLAPKAKAFFEEINVPMEGDGVNNHYRITPMGTMQRTWLTISDFAMSTLADKLPWKKVAIFNIIGLLDFYPQFIADEFAKMGTESSIHLFSMPDIDLLHRNPSEMRSTNIARVLDKPENVKELISILKSKCSNSDCEAIILPACLGLDKSDKIDMMEKEVGKPIFLLPTLPPSIVGIRTQQYMHDYFQKLGGVYMLGDSILKAEVEGGKVKQLYSYNHTDIPFIGKNIILATGSYFSQGLIATNEKVYEPIFGLDVDYETNRTAWYDPNMFEKQAYQSFGVKTNETFNALKDGKPLDNLYVSGAILEGFNPIREGSGGGVSILSALYVADKILSK